MSTSASSLGIAVGTGALHLYIGRAASNSWQGNWYLWAPPEKEEPEPTAEYLTREYFGDLPFDFAGNKKKEVLN